MTTSVEIYRTIQAKARSEAARTGRPTATGEYLTRHALESFLYRLTRTAHADSFVLKSVAGYRGVDLVPVTPVIAGYGEIGQDKWAAWRRKEGMEAISEEKLDSQMALVAAILDPIFRPHSTP